MTLIIAHRGASRAAPENTVAAFRRAVAMGADAVALDVRRTRDDRLVVHHDPTREGRALRAMGVDELPTGVPELAEALDACAGVVVNIEIKNDPDEPDHDPSEWVAGAVAALLARRGGGLRWLISSFRIQTVDRVRRIAPGVRTAWLTYQLDDAAIAAVVAGGHHAVHPYYELVSAESLRAAHAAGIAVNTWTCDDPERMADLIAWGIDGICTNVPDVALAVRARWGTPA